MSADYPDERVIKWVILRGDDGTEKRIPWLRDPKTPEELALTEQAVHIIRKAQEQEDAQRSISGRQRRYRKQRLRQFRDRWRGYPQG